MGIGFQHLDGNNPFILNEHSCLKHNFKNMYSCLRFLFVGKKREKEKTEKERDQSIVKWASQNCELIQRLHLYQNLEKLDFQGLEKRGWREREKNMACIERRKPTLTQDNVVLEAGQPKATKSHQNSAILWIPVGVCLPCH